ncbi:MAG: ankyrin repeat domain-containing protein [Wolbachia sp.]
MNSEVQPMGIKSNLLVQATKYNNKRVVKFTLGLFDALGKLFSPARKKEPFHSREDNQHLNDALVFAVENLNYDMVELLVNAGADVNSLDKNNRNAIMHAVEKLATSKGLSVDPSKNLPEEIISHPIVQFLLVRGSEYYITDNIDIEGRHASRIKGNVRHSLQSEPIYEEIPAKNTETQPVYDDRRIYGKVDGF